MKLVRSSLLLAFLIQVVACLRPAVAFSALVYELEDFMDNQRTPWEGWALDSNHDIMKFDGSG